MKTVPWAAATTVLFLSSTALAVPTRLDFTGVITAVSGDQPLGAIGQSIFGSYVFDYDPVHYTLVSDPAEGSNFGGYSYLGEPYGVLANLSTLAQATTHNVAISVYDNGSLVPSYGIPSDTVMFGAKNDEIYYTP